MPSLPSVGTAGGDDRRVGLSPSDLIEATPTSPGPRFRRRSAVDPSHPGELVAVDGPEHPGVISSLADHPTCWGFGLEIWLATLVTSSRGFAATSGESGEEGAG